MRVDPEQNRAVPIYAIAHVSDLHFGKLDAPVAAGLVADLSNRSPTLVVVSGDLTQRARSRQYLDAMAYLTRLPQPQLIIPGNHDIPLFNIFARFLDPMGQYQKFVTKDLAPTFRREGLAIMGLNTARSLTQASGWIEDAQLDQVCSFFSDDGDDTLKVLVTHHPFIPAPKDPKGDIVLGAREALAKLEACGVDLLLAGHLHFAYHDDVRKFHSETKRSTLSIQAGTATSTRRRGEPNAYNWIEVEPDRVRVEVRAWDGNRFAASLHTSFERRGGVWERQIRAGIEVETRQAFRQIISAAAARMIAAAAIHGASGSLRGGQAKSIGPWSEGRMTLPEVDRASCSIARRLLPI